MKDDDYQDQPEDIEPEDLDLDDDMNLDNEEGKDGNEEPEPEDIGTIIVSWFWQVLVV